MEYHIRILFAILVLCPQCLTIPQGCNGLVDLIFLVDSSNSMLDLSPFGDPLLAWRSHQTFMNQVVSELPVGTQSKVSLVTYANSPSLNFHLQQHSTSINVQDAILSASFLGGNTNSAAAFRMIQDPQLLQSRATSGVRKVVVAFTDGLTNLETKYTQQEAEFLLYQGAEVFVVAVSREINPDVLDFMASSPKDKHILTLNGIKDLDEELALILAHRICGVEDPITTTPPPSCLPGCGVCQDDDVCLQCAEGFYKEGNNCLPCMANCGVCENSEKCMVCIVGWYWESLTSTCEACEVKADLVFVIDSSGSIRDANPLDGSYDNYQILKDFIKEIIRRLDVSPDSTRIGAVLFSSQARVLFYLDEFIAGDQMANMIQDMHYHGSKTNIAAGLDFMRTQLFTGSRGDRPDVRNVGLVITDGESTVQQNRTQLEGQLARDEDIALFVVGATDQINVEELKGIASDPDDEHFFESPEIRYLDSVMESLIKHVCTPGIIDAPTAGIH